jgi:hypothetical protein
MKKPPVGKREGERLEFKRAESVDQPLGIVREIVGMLNASGGDIWIGMGEDAQGRGIITGIEDPGAARRRILDCLVETIEPAVSDEEVTILESDAVVLVRVSPDASRRPYALVQGAKREFPRRIADRLRPMTHEELFAGPRTGIPSDQREVAGLLQARRTELLTEERDTDGRLWIRIEPEPSLNVDLTADLWKRVLTDPDLSRNRETGWTCIMPYGDLHLRKERYICGEPGYVETSVYRSGGLEHLAPLGALYWKGPEREIWPLVLLELPTSLFRVAAFLARDSGPLEGARHVQADIGLYDLAGWKLRGGSPRSIAARTEPPHPFQQENDLLLPNPLRFPRADVVEHPDRCAYQLVRQVYYRFGFKEDAIPREYDRGSGQLRLP